MSGPLWTYFPLDAFGQLQRSEQLSSQMRRKERTKLRGSTRHPEVGKVISDGDGERGAMPVLLPAHHRPVGCREWVFPVRRSGRPRWLPTLSAGRHRIGRMRISSSARAWQSSRSESAGSIFEIGGTRGAGVSRCRRGAIQPVQRAPQRTDPARLHMAVLAGRASRLGGGRRAGERARRPAPRPDWAEGNRCQPSPPSVCLVAMLIPGPVITSGLSAARQAAQPVARSPRPGRVPPRSGRHRVAAAPLAATRAPGHEPHDDEYGHRDQSDDDKRLERSHDPARSRDGKPYGEDRAEDCPDDPAHVPSMPPDLCRR